jgi:hypothetical protein
MVELVLLGETSAVKHVSICDNHCLALRYHTPAPRYQLHELPKNSSSFQ